MAPKTTFADWTAWFADHEKRTTQVYLIDPDRLLASFHQENETAGDYAGRELLELLQNASDAAALIGKEADVRIDYDNDGIVIANTGAPFHTGGVRSLLMAHLSSKPDEQAARMIGQKGLGFRALLNWAPNVVLASDEPSDIA